MLTAEDDQGRRIHLLDDRRPIDAIAGTKPLAVVERTGNEGTGLAQPYVAPTERCRACVGAAVGGLPDIRLAHDAGRFRAEGYELHRLVLGDKSVVTDYSRL